MTSVTSKNTANAGFNIKITGINQTLRKLDLLLDGIEEEIDELLLEFTKDYHKFIVDTAPVDLKIYKSNWFWNQTNIGKFVIWNDVSMVYRPGVDIYYSKYLVEPNPRFVGTVDFGRYMFADPNLGIIHDLSQIKTLMMNDLDKSLNTFYVKKAAMRKGI